ncbi:hypothetical protein GCM10025867_32660 [Frondihabitans sucicola]|uniref:Fibronectin type-III domain-containing protein n=1 Tax=Frondihabitans sucicola TaxID=1268041 RepID=A0ABN6Y147_9MICO|nr:fibronectin type III domain-containing protein [Frondihabitans sucicola]BDZ51025.1 hypothetical protein GCM10025867_32660 [Frondihabitans sucicola]
MSWNTVPQPARGTPVTGYVVEMAGSGAPGTQTVSGTSVTVGGLTPAAQYTAQVYAKNDAQVSTSADWARSGSATGTAVGTPASVSDLSASNDQSSAHVTLNWSGVGAQGASGVTYSVARFDSGSAGPSGCSSKPSSIVTGLTATSYVDTSAAEGSAYTYYVYADNGLFCSTSNSSTVPVYKAPGQAQKPTATVAESGAGTGYFDVALTGLAASGTVKSYWLYVDGVDMNRSIGEGAVVTSSADASVYGTQHRYAVRACRLQTQSVCGPVSDPVLKTPVNANVTGNAVYQDSPGDGSTLNRTGNWTFTLPAGSGYEGVAYQCEGGDVTSDGGSTCSGTGADPLNGPTLLIRVTANGGDFYDKTYTAPLLGN